MIRLIVFDFDGTLVDSNRIKETCLVQTAASVPGGLALLPAARAGGGNRYRIFAELAHRLEPDADEARIAGRASELAAAYTRCCSRGVVAAPERRGARQALAALRRRGKRIWINSATPGRDLPHLLVRRGLMGMVDGALGGPDSKAKNLRKTLAAERVGPRETLMVGDGPDDLAAARELGIRFVAVTAEQRIPDRLPHAAQDLRTLVALVDRLDPRPRRYRTSNRAIP